jgi:hypothetical protein
VRTLSVVLQILSSSAYDLFDSLQEGIAKSDDASPVIPQQQLCSHSTFAQESNTLNFANWHYLTDQLQA